MADMTVGSDPTAETVRIKGHRDAEIEAYLARLAGPGPPERRVGVTNLPPSSRSGPIRQTPSPANPRGVTLPLRLTTRDLPTRLTTGAYVLHAGREK
jgi:hypothetical protein